MSDTGDPRCRETVRRGDAWHTHTCGRPVKRDGMCGVHAAARERIKANDIARREARIERQQIAEVLTGLLGLTVHADLFDEAWRIDAKEVRAWWAENAPQQDGEQP